MYHPSMFQHPDQFAFPHGTPSISTRVDVPQITTQISRVPQGPQLHLHQGPQIESNRRDLVLRAPVHEGNLSGTGNLSTLVANVPNIHVPSQFKVKDLEGVVDRHYQTRLRPLKEVTGLCYARIKKAAELGCTDCLYEIPLFVVGQPLFDYGDCSSFLTEHLQSNGFDVTLVSRRHIYVRWSVRPNPHLTRQETKVTDRVEGREFMRDNVYTTSQRPVVLVESIIRPENGIDSRDRIDKEEFKPPDANKRKPRVKKTLSTIEVKKEDDEVFFGKKVSPETKRKPKSLKTAS